jgi:hypothetical protein
MAAVSVERLRRILRFYAQLSPPPLHQDDLVAAPPTDFAWLGTEQSLFQVDRGRSGIAQALAPQHVGSLEFPVSATAERLARLGALHAEEQLLREGWVFLAGTLEVHGRRQRILQPLLSRPVDLRRRSLAARAVDTFLQAEVAPPRYLLSAAGEAEITPLVGDAAARARLESTAEFGGGALTLDKLTRELLRKLPKLRHWIEDVTAETGLHLDKVLHSSPDPYDYVDRPGLVAVIGSGLYLSRRVSQVSVQSSLLNWAGRDDLEDTGFGVLMTATDDGSDPVPPADPHVRSPMALSPSQRDVVRHARTDPLTVVSGAPGTGKTHTVCAVAFDAIARGQSVLVATRSAAAANVVAELLDRTPGPDPVRFGSAAGMAVLIDALSERQLAPLEESVLHRLDLDLASTRARADGLRTLIDRALELEEAAAGADGWEVAAPALIPTAPALFEPESDLEAASGLLVAASGSEPGFWARRRRGRAERHLRRMALAAPGTSLTDLEVALTAARSRRASAELAAHGGTGGLPWTDLAVAMAEERTALGRRLEASPYDPRTLDASARRSLGELIAALRAGRGRRRDLLGQLRAGDLTHAAPLWIGTLSEIEDVLPANPGLFDLVILDEASQIDQMRAVPALVRGRRVVVVGDPHQLRHVSFISDDAAADALAVHDLSEERARLDVRRVSAFDLAAASAPVLPLREHFRSIPHLIAFPMRRFYGDTVTVMTRHPRCERIDAIDVVTVEAPHGRPSVHGAEVDAVEEVVRGLVVEGATSVGVITPFREQADALEDMLTERFTDEEIEALSLRTGTIHAFQGGERDVMVASLGLGPHDPTGRRTFLEDPNLFNVLVTRARRRMVVVTSLEPSFGGLVGDYLHHAEHGLAPVGDAGSDDRWIAGLAEELRRARFETRRGYPVGPWRLDLVVGDGDGARSVVCRVHDGGPAAHIDRHLTLMSLRWTMVDAFPSRWDGDAVRAALDLTVEVGP